MSDATEEFYPTSSGRKGFQIHEAQISVAPIAPQGIALEQLIENLTTAEQNRLSEGSEIEPETHWLPLYELLLKSEVLLVVSKSCISPGSRTVITMAHDTVQFPVFSRLETAIKDEDRALFFDFVWVKFSTLCRLALAQGAEGILLNADGPIDILFDYYEMKYIAENQLPPQRPVLHEQALNNIPEPLVVPAEVSTPVTPAFRSMRFISRVET